MENYFNVFVEVVKDEKHTYYIIIFLRIVCNFSCVELVSDNDL